MLLIYGIAWRSEGSYDLAAQAQGISDTLHFLISHGLFQYSSTLRGIIDDLYIYTDNSTVLLFHYVLTYSTCQNLPCSFSNRVFVILLCRAALVLAADLDVLVAQLDGIVVAALGILVNPKLCKAQLVNNCFLCRTPAISRLHSL